MTETYLDIRLHEPSPGMRVLTVRGELDLATAPRLADALHPVIRGRGQVVVDLRGVSFIDMLGLNVLLKGHRRVRQRGGGITLVYDSGPVMRLLELTELIALFPRDAADRAKATLDAHATSARPAVS